MGLCHHLRKLLFSAMFYRVKVSQQHNSTARCPSSICSFFMVQGLPAAVCVATAVIDSYGPQEWILPGMGVHQCFLTSRSNEAINSYFESAYEIYYHVFVFILIGFNLAYFMKLVVYLIKHWVAIKHLNRSGESKVLERFSLIARCFIIMGLPTVFITIADVLEFVNGKKNLHVVNLSLFCLLSGVYMFLTLICKKSVLDLMKAKCTRVNTTLISSFRNISARQN